MGFFQTQPRREWPGLTVRRSDDVQARLIAVGAVLVAVTGLTGCASKDDDDTSGTTPTTTTPTETSTGPTDTPSQAPNTIEITIEGDTVTPNGKTVEVPLGETVTLSIHADQPGELHVHSTPEQEIGYDAGDSTHTLTFDQPGVVAVESHDLDKIIVQLEVR
jgi:hypothetical protein